MEDSKTSNCSSKSPWARERISSKSIDNLGTRSQKGLPALLQGKVAGDTLDPDIYGQ